MQKWRWQVFATSNFLKSILLLILCSFTQQSLSQQSKGTSGVVVGGDSGTQPVMLSSSIGSILHDDANWLILLLHHHLLFHYFKMLLLTVVTLNLM